MQQWLTAEPKHVLVWPGSGSAACWNGSESDALQKILGPLN
jgi:hypothetical protein